MSKVLVPQDNFIKKTHELSSLLKNIEAGSRDAVDVLVNTMNSDDKEVPLKLKVECADKLLHLQVKIADTISKDQLTRQIASIKVKGMSASLGSEDRPLAPILDMTTIQQIG